MSKVLQGDALQQAAKKIDTAWSVIPGKGLIRIVETDSYGEGFMLVAAIAELAEAKNHHPDLTLKYGEVEITLYSHDANGITDRDITMAGLIDKLLD
jgi:4a-hydroxytetrahydrobiopterin dehydratase